MTYGAAWGQSEIFEYGRRSQNALVHPVLGAVALACVAGLCAMTLCAVLPQADESEAPQAAPPAGSSTVIAAASAVRHAAGQPSDHRRSNFDAALFNARFAATFPPGTYLGADPVQSNDTSASAASKPTTLTMRDIAPMRSQSRRLAHAASPRALARRSAALPPPLRDTIPATRTADEPAEKPTIFGRLFGRPATSIFQKLFGPSPAKMMLAYAGPEDGGLGDGAGLASGHYDRQTAVYDISAHKVYLPDGTVLEAHSGLGSKLDDPRYANERNSGVTPPDVYDLELREQPFHGVHALRLIPVDDAKVFGRTGLLAHSYMLGPNGDSNGCVSFKDYDAFLQAYMKGEIKRLAVVARVD